MWAETVSILKRCAKPDPRGRLRVGNQGVYGEFRKKFHQQIRYLLVTLGILDGCHRGWKSTSSAARRVGLARCTRTTHRNAVVSPLAQV